MFHLRKQENYLDWPVMADCRPPSKASNFATSDRGSAWYAALKPPLARSTALTPALLALDGKHFRDSFMS